MNDEIVLSGYGLVTAYGWGAGRFWGCLREGTVALGPEASSRNGRIIATVPARDDGPVPGRRREALMADVVAEALAHAGMDGIPEGSLVVIAGQAPPISAARTDPRWCDFTGYRDPVLPGVPASAEIVHLSHACATAAFGLAFAQGWLAAALGPAALVVGACALNDYEIASMDVVRALTSTGVRPFAPDRDGTAIGEGGGAVILEPRARAEARGVRRAPVLAGVGHRVGGEGKGGTDVALAVGAMQDALAGAGVDRVDYVHAHATGTVQGDEAELVALQAVADRYGWADVAVSSHKGAIGHLLHSSALPGVIAAAGVLADEVLPGTPGLAHPVERSALRVLTETRPCPGPKAVLVNSFGFGGNNASVVLRATTSGTGAAR